MYCLDCLRPYTLCNCELASVVFCRCERCEPPKKKMKRTIWKFRLDQASVEIPFGWERLHVARQEDGPDAGAPCLWVLVNPTAAKVRYKPFVVGTGHTVPRGCDMTNFIGSTQEGIFVWHWFLVAE
jgi:hypothetical protein